MIDLKAVLEENPGCVSSRTAFKSVLSDRYPGEKRMINILTILFECGAAAKIRSKDSLGVEETGRLTMQIENEYGIPALYSWEAVCIWAAAYGVRVDVAEPVAKPATTCAETAHAPIFDGFVVESDEFDYETSVLDSGLLSIDKFAGFEEKTIVIPSRINGIGVAKIGDGAFAKCASVEKVIVPEGVRRIGTKAFFGCKSLKNIVLPSTLMGIGGRAFEGCAFASIDLPADLKNIVGGAFFNCRNLVKVNIPNGVKRIPADCFWGCSSLKEVLLPDELTQIGTAAFYGSGLIRVDIPVGVSMIDDNTFGRCRNLISIGLHEGLLKIRRGAFVGCDSLSDIKIPRSVNEIQDAFDRPVRGGKCLTIACYSGSKGLVFARENGYRIKNAAG